MNNFHQKHLLGTGQANRANGSYLNRNELRVQRLVENQKILGTRCDQRRLAHLQQTIKNEAIEHTRHALPFDSKTLGNIPIGLIDYRPPTQPVFPTTMVWIH